MWLVYPVPSVPSVGHLWQEIAVGGNRPGRNVEQNVSQQVLLMKSTVKLKVHVGARSSISEI